MKHFKSPITFALAFVFLLILSSCVSNDTDPAGDALERQISYNGDVEDERTALLSDSLD